MERRMRQRGSESRFGSARGRERKKGCSKEHPFLKIAFASLVLPGASDGIDPELIRVRWPVGSCSKRSATCAVGWYATELVIDRRHRILGDTPRVVLLHGNDRWNDQSRRLAGSHPVVPTVPRALGRLAASPIIAPTRVPTPGGQRAVLAGVWSEDPISESVSAEMTDGSLAGAGVAVADDHTLPQPGLRHQKRRCEHGASEDKSLIHTLLTSLSWLKISRASSVTLI